MQVIRDATQAACKEIMPNITTHGIKRILPFVLRALSERAWRTKMANIEVGSVWSVCVSVECVCGVCVWSVCVWLQYVVYMVRVCLCVHNFYPLHYLTHTRTHSCWAAWLTALLSSSTAACP
jgi:hypothetical protein